jgi:hypothetical protein
MAVAFSEIQVGEPVCYEALSVFPLFDDSSSPVEYLLSNEGIGSGCVTVEEVSESGSVPDLLVENKGDIRIFRQDLRDFGVQLFVCEFRHGRFRRSGVAEFDKPQDSLERVQDRSAPRTAASGGFESIPPHFSKAMHTAEPAEHFVTEADDAVPVGLLPHLSEKLVD